MNITIDVICYKFTTLKNGESPLKLRITKNRKRKYLNIGISVNPSHWDFDKNQPKPTCPDKDYIEKIMSDRISEYRTKVLELKAENKEFTAHSLADNNGKNNKSITVKELFVQHIESLKYQRRHGYAASIQQVYNSLVKFNKHLNIYFSDIDIQWLKRYEVWLRKEGMSENTIGVRFRTLRTLYNLAIEEGAVKPDYYPFKKFKVSKLHKATVKRAITKEEIMRIINLPKDGRDYYTCLAIDLFTFSYLTGGINFVDMAYLTENNLIDNKVIYTRRKTSKLISLPVHPKALSIIENYHVNKYSYLFPILTTYHKTDQQKINRVHKVITKVNRALKEIGKQLGIPVHLTTYVARHSYATVLKRSGIPTGIISESLGHSNEKITQVYLDSFENEQLNKAIENLL